MDLSHVGPYEVLPEMVFDKVFCPSVETDPITGEVKVAQVGLRRMKVSLLQGGYKKKKYSWHIQKCFKNQLTRYQSCWN